MFNNKGESKMNNLKVDTIKKLLMLDTEKELSKIKLDISDAISRECDNDDKDQVEFAKWKAERGKNETDQKILVATQKNNELNVLLKKKEENDDEIPF